MLTKEHEHIVVQGPQLHRREVAQAILDSRGVQTDIYDPRELPTHGLQSFTVSRSEIPRTVAPREILSLDYAPRILIDVDETVVEHVACLVAGLNTAFGTAITMNELQAAKFSRKVPAWSTTPEDLELHDSVVTGKHPLVYPFVNRALPGAVRGVATLDRMGHIFSYLTGRNHSLYPVTKRALEWNRFVYDGQVQAVDAKTHPVPVRGYLYCTYAPPTEAGEYKVSVVRQWLYNLQARGWKGELVILDDMAKVYEPFIVDESATVIALKGPINANREIIPGEVRVNTWDDILTHVHQVHERTLERDPTPYRLFDCGDHIPGYYIVVNKEKAGCGSFHIFDVPDCFALVSYSDWAARPGEILAEIGIT